MISKIPREKTLSIVVKQGNMIIIEERLGMIFLHYGEKIDIN